jgi:glycosyltransferase involved in cell wall biosynthesis
MELPRPRILYLCSSWPLGRAFGGQLRALQVARALQQMGEVTVAVVSSDAKDIEAESRTGAEFALETPILPQIRPNQSISEKLRWALDSKYLNVHGVMAAASDRERLIASFEKYDLIWVLNARTPNILQRWRWPNAHLDIDDLPSTYARGERRNGASMARRWKASAQSFIARRRELLFRERFTTLSVCSEADRNYLGGGDGIHVIPNGFERPAQEPVRDPSTNPPRIGFMGLYSYAPNLEGVRWFLLNCWPAIRREVPGIRLRLAGKDTDGALRPNEPDVDVLGWLADAASEIATWSAMIIPIRLGGGTRVKIADAFSRKCPVVSTRLGAFGYNVESGRELLLVDDNEPQGFASACISLIRDPVSANAMAERAFHAFLEKWTWDAIAPKVWAAAEDCLRRSERSCYRERNHVLLRSNGSQP